MPNTERQSSLKTMHLIKSMRLSAAALNNQRLRYLHLRPSHFLCGVSFWVAIVMISVSITPEPYEVSFSYLWIMWHHCQWHSQATEDAGARLYVPTMGSY